MAQASLGRLSGELQENKTGWSRWVRMARDFLIDLGKESFSKQGTGNIVWPPRSVPNLAGIVSDAKAGATTISQKRLQSRPAGIDTGALRASIKGRIEGRRVVIYSGLEYAERFYKGGTNSISIGGSTANNVAAMLASSAINSPTLSAIAKGRVKSLTVTSPPRRMLQVLKQDKEKIAKMAIQVMKEIKA